MAFTKVNGSDLHYESIRVEHPEDDTILIFLHEALGSIPQWRSFPSELCQKLNLNGIVYEREGYGMSSPLKTVRDDKYLHNYALIELPAFLDTIVPADKKVILVGHSDGGTIALLFASRFPKRVHSIITIAAHVINETETIAGIAPAIEAFQSGKLSKLKDFHGDKTEVLFYAWANTWKSDEFKDWNICDDIKNVSCPSLILQGSKDQYGTEKQLALIKAHVTGPCKTILIPDCGHHPHLEKMKEVLKQIAEWTIEQKTIVINSNF